MTGYKMLDVALMTAYVSALLVIGITTSVLMFLIYRDVTSPHVHQPAPISAKEHGTSR